MIKPNFNKYPDGLMPAIIQDSETEKVLMLGYMNKEAHELTIQEGKVIFFSRSKDRLWMKGETSGNFLIVKNIISDCDNDCLLIKAKPIGPICHSGTDTCFAENNTNDDFLLSLEKIILQRKTNPKSGSYTSSLFQKGINKIAQKVGEEAVELIIEAKDDNIDLFKNEAADLLFHYLILLQSKDLELKDIVEVLKKRNNIAENESEKN